MGNNKRGAKKIRGLSLQVMPFSEVGDLNIRIYAFTLEGFTRAYQVQQEFLKQLIALKTDKDKELPLGSPTMGLIHEFEYICELAYDEKVQKKYL